ncbi:hypothetical protein [Syntrophaceticus schinkii]|uniref:Uncharacterized protein n=1 Tax=Syntrophaceticus schinkii TaxID=499207 RepID=A0A0B7MRQ5_9FIRM|nr:hypothetical protein [Syntrophaceticus schinkii]CEO90347.1 hypothetical protein SSCH_810020 [Syntrophaceticus schinkii]
MQLCRKLEIREKMDPRYLKSKKASLAKIEVRSGRLEVGIEVGNARGWMIGKR